MGLRKRHLLVETPFPIYSISLLGSYHFAIAGGGGQAKTGVPNLIEIYHIDLTDDCELKATKVHVADTQTLATMNMDVLFVPTASSPGLLGLAEPGQQSLGVCGPFVIAAGQDRYCKIYDLQYDVACLLNGHIVPLSQVVMNDVQQRHGHGHSNDASDHRIKNGLPPGAPVPVKRLGFEVLASRSIQTDSHPKNPFQKVVRLAPDGSRMITGGTDGHYRVWDLKSQKKLVDHNAHKDDVDDISISPDGNRFLSLGRDGRAFIWNINDGSKFSDIPNPPMGIPIKYRFRAGRFSTLGRRGFLFYTVSIPIARQARGTMSYITQWIMLDKDVKCIKSVSTGKEVTSALAISDCGHFLGIGTLSGSISLWDALELNCLVKFSEIHDIFVTGLTFLPTAPSEGTKLASFMHPLHCACLSVSADNTVQVHSLPRRQCRSVTWQLFCYATVVCFIAFLLSWLEL